LFYYWFILFLKLFDNDFEHVVKPLKQNFIYGFYEIFEHEFYTFINIYLPNRFILTFITNMYNKSKRKDAVLFCIYIVLKIPYIVLCIIFLLNLATNLRIINEITFLLLPLCFIGHIWCNACLKTCSGYFSTTPQDLFRLNFNKTAKFFKATPHYQFVIIVLFIWVSSKIVAYFA
jgi:hypothetical protein